MTVEELEGYLSALVDANDTDRLQHLLEALCAMRPEHVVCGLLMRDMGPGELETFAKGYQPPS